VALAWTVKDGKKDGAEIFVSIDGLIEKMDYFKEGSLTGSVHYFKTGNKKDSTVYLNGEVIYRTNWFENGTRQLEATNHQQTVWYDNSQRKIVKQLGDAKLLEGEVTFWFADGTVKYKGQWSKGKPVGIHEYRRRPSGKLKQVRFENIPKADRLVITG
jgi:antitoxin component YwqK of YwqJK toxin-antitoxin module